MIYTRDDYWTDVRAIMRARTYETACDIARVMAALGHYDREAEAALKMRQDQENPV